MLLAVDVGNTETVVGLYADDESDVFDHWRIATNAQSTGDEHALLLTQFLGLYVASALYLGFYVRAVGRHKWVTALALAIVLPVVTFVLFERWFLVPLPKGPVEAWLGD